MKTHGRVVAPNVSRETQLRAVGSRSRPAPTPWVGSQLLAPSQLLDTGTVWSGQLVGRGGNHGRVSTSLGRVERLYNECAFIYIWDSNVIHYITSRL